MAAVTDPRVSSATPPRDVQPVRRDRAAGALATTQILAPRFGRLLTWSLAAAGANDWLQAEFAALSSKSNELERRSG